MGVMKFGRTVDPGRADGDDAATYQSFLMTVIKCAPYLISSMECESVLRT